MSDQRVRKHYRDIAFLENRSRLRLLSEFNALVIKYFDNSTLNMVSGQYLEANEAIEARAAINLILKKAYQVIQHAGIKTYTASTPSVSVRGNDKNIDLILNIFNLGRNEIDPHAAVDYIERAISVYKSNRLPSFIRALNPFFWISVLLKYR